MCPQTSELEELRQRFIDAVAAASPEEQRYRRGTYVPFSTLLLDWASSSEERQLSIHLLEPDEPFDVDHFFKDLTGLRNTRDLALRLRRPLESVPLVVRALQLWIIEGSTEHDVETALNESASSLGLET